MNLTCLRTRWRYFIHIFGTLTTTCVVCKDSNVRQMATSQDSTSASGVKRLLAVQGFNERKNDIIFCKTINSGPPESRVIFFGGDSQDYPENMELHRDNHRFGQWNLINTAVILSKKFNKSDIFVIKPSQMHLKSFSCYNNFIQSSIVGAPTHNSDNNAIIHLKMLISNASKLAERELSSAHGDLATEREIELPLILVGFSKGSVVLNQIVHELHLADVNPDVELFLRLITEFYWLDGGNPSGKDTWVTDVDLLRKLAALDVRISVCVTPYQINDHHRPWLKKEEKIFSDTLKRLNAKIERKVFFENEERDISIHFGLLEKF